jgi:ribonucleoside-triphosphate reductase
MNPIQAIVKRNGDIVSYDRAKIAHAILKAAQATDSGHDRQWAENLAQRVEVLIVEKFGQNGHAPHVEDIQDIVEQVLIKDGQAQIAKAYILYREQRSHARDTRQLILDGMKLVDDYLDRADWRVNENANMNYSLQGLNFYVASSVTARYWLQKIYPPEIRQAHVEGALHIHDLGVLAA